MGFKARKDKTPTNEHLVDLLRQTIGPRSDVEEKRMFGGVAFLLKGKMTVGVNGDSLMVRVLADSFEEALAHPHARPMDFTGRLLKSFLYISRAGWANNEERKMWVDHGFACARSKLAAR